MAEQTISTIEKRRQTMQIPIEKLCAAASYDQRTYHRATLGEVTVRPATLAKLNHALHRFQIGFAGEASQIAPHAAFKACVILAAFAAGGEWHARAKSVLSDDPGRRATADKTWLANAHIRRIGFSIANQVFGFSQSDVARAAGVTKAAVSQALGEIEDLRDHDPALDQLLNRIEEIVLA